MVVSVSVFRWHCKARVTARWEAIALVAMQVSSFPSSNETAVPIYREREIGGSDIHRWIHFLAHAMMRSAAAAAAAFINSPPPFLFIVLISSHLLSLALAASPSSEEGYMITGRLKLGGATSKEFGLPSKPTNAKVILNGGQRITFARADGYFSFHNVPAGTHLIEVVALGYFFSPVRVDISARNPGTIQAALTENRRVLYELVLEPLKEEQYYEVRNYKLFCTVSTNSEEHLCILFILLQTREPFSIMSLVKSPMGLMMGFMILMVFIMPKMMENIDPEEMRRAQEEMRAQGVPSLSNLLSRGN
ncbi:ER membrane protein complex subunit [Canna indica]|uniref:ER membrane protein complex subunit n=1 Tax=Canna indica TaxID=4628 RepID=A0AAQ3KXQ6_9LILI|nr:ER membrane protein complex subunit [Canna indica]